VFFVTAEAKDAVLVPVGALRPAGTGESRRGGESRPQSKSADPGAAVDARARLANGPAAVRVVRPGGAIETRDVRVGVVSRVSAQIVSGLEPGEQVVVGQRATAPASPAKPSPTSRPMMGPRV
jgi:macrolide-specific efflux system membrane fusion protein